MGKVRLKFPLWFAGMIYTQGSDLLDLEKEIGEATTINGLLTELASSYADFRREMFNPEIGIVGSFVVFLNDNLLQLPAAADTKLNDGDNVTILPVYTGG